MADFPALPLWTDAYLADTRHLSTVEHGAYLLLLMEAWRRPSCSLPDNDKLLARLAGLSIDEWSNIKELVLRFWEYDGRRKEWTQKRLVKERSYLQEISSKNRNAALSRWKDRKKSDANAMPKGMPNVCQNDAPTPTPIKRKGTDVPKKKIGSRLPDDFKPDNRWSVSQGLSIEVLEREFEKFKNYWQAKSGKDATKLDWQKTWKNWIINVKERLGTKNNPRNVGEYIDQQMKGQANDKSAFKGSSGFLDQGEAGRNQSEPSFLEILASTPKQRL